MLTLEEIKARLEDVNLMAVSRKTGLTYPTVYNTIKKDSAPSYDTVRRLSNYLERN
tara:strand:+ start:2811 stop:2978 length:168 start_codon:yes stop_codon:yes gene_type:complete